MRLSERRATIFTGGTSSRTAACARMPARATIAADTTVHFRAEAAALGRTMSRKRRSYEAGPKAKFLVVFDDTPECDRALYFASRRAARVGVSVIMLRVIDTHDRNQQWLGAADIMRAEAHEEADASLGRASARANGIAGITPEKVIREGETTEESF